MTSGNVQANTITIWVNVETISYQIKYILNSEFKNILKFEFEFVLQHILLTCVNYFILESTTLLFEPIIILDDVVKQI